MSAPGTARQDVATEQELVSLLVAAFPVGAPCAPPGALEPARWHTLEELARRNGLTGMLWRALEVLKRADVPAAVAASLQDRYRRSALAQALAYRELEGVMGDCAKAHIPLIVLKGAALARTLYPESPLRPFGDLDVFLPRADAFRLREILLARSLREADVTHGFNPAYYGEMAFFPSRTQEFMVDLHWELVAPAYFRRRMDLRWFWDNTDPFVLGAQSAQTLNPTAQLVHLAAHAGLHHQDNLRLIWLYDIALLLARRGREIDWRAAGAYARAASLARPVRAMLDAAHARWGVPLPAETRALFSPSPFALRERALYAITTTRFPEARMLSDALNTPGAGNKIGVIRQQLFPDAAYMRTRYHVQNESLMPFYYARRVVETGFKFARSLWTALTRR